MFQGVLCVFSSVWRLYITVFCHSVEHLLFFLCVFVNILCVCLWPCSMLDEQYKTFYSTSSVCNIYSTVTNSDLAQVSINFVHTLQCFWPCACTLQVYIHTICTSCSHVYCTVTVYETNGELFLNNSFITTYFVYLSDPDLWSVYLHIYIHNWKYKTQKCQFTSTSNMTFNFI